MSKRDIASKSDEELMENYQMGEAMAFDILFERYSGRVLGFLSQKLGSQREAQDLLQEVFFKLHRSRHQYNKTLPFAPWLFSITRSIFLDSLKKQKNETLMEPETIEKLAPIVQVQTSSETFEQKILDQLPVNQKEAVALRVFDDATFEEIALRLSTSPENARQLFSRGVKRLREILKVGKE